MVSVIASAVMLVSCGNDDDIPLLAGNTQAASGEGEALFVKAKAADAKGKRSSAIKLY